MPFDLSQLETEGIFLNVGANGFSTLERQIDWKSLGVELPAQGSVNSNPRAYFQSMRERTASAA